MLRSLFVLTFLACHTLAGFINANTEPAHRFIPPNQTDYDVIVVGAGGGGLSAAAKLAYNGYKPLVIDRSNRVGGAWVTFNLTGDDGHSYRVDGSLHVLEKWSDSPVEVDYFKLLQQTGAFDKIQWTPKRSIHRLVLDKESPMREWTVFTDKDRLTAELNKTWPGHEGEISSLLDYTSKVVDQVLSISELSYTNSTLDKVEKLVHMLAKCPEMRETMAQTAHDMTTRFISNPEMLAILTSPVMYCAVPDKQLAAILYAEMAGMWFKYGMTNPVGGSGAIAHHLAEYIESQGGRILLETEVNSIITEEKNGKPVATGVQGLHFNGSPKPDALTFTARTAVVSDVNLPLTINMVGQEIFPDKFLKRLEKFNISDSVFTVSLGLKNKTVLEKIQGDPEILLTDSLDMNREFARIKTGVLSFMDLNDYSQVDPECCGDRAAVALVNCVPFDLWNPDPEEREKQKMARAHQMIDRAEGYLPGFKDSIDMSTLMIVDPYVAQQWMGTPLGTEMGYLPTLEAENFFDGIPMQNLPIDSLYQVGQFSFPGGGQPTVSQSGQTAAMMIINGVGLAKH